VIGVGAAAGGAAQPPLPWAEGGLPEASTAPPRPASGQIAC